MQTLDTILVLTGPLRDHDREERTLDLWNGIDGEYLVDGATPIIITGNYTGFNDYLCLVPPQVPDAIVMRDRLISRGIPQNQFLIEPEAKDTAANFINAEQFLSNTSARHVGLVTSGYHMERSLRIGKHIYGNKYDLHPCPSYNNGTWSAQMLEKVIAAVIMHDLRKVRSGDKAGFAEYLVTEHPFHGKNPGGLYTQFVLLKKFLSRKLPPSRQQRSSASGMRREEISGE